MIKGFPQTKKNSIRGLAAGGALLISTGLFLVIPLTQNLNDTEKDSVEYRTMLMAPPPPPAFIPPSEEVSDMEIDLQPVIPKMERPVEEVPLRQLELSLAPGMGVALSMGIPNIPTINGIDTLADIEKVFNFDELLQVPTLLNGQMIRADFPRELARRGLKEARINLEILIDKTGKVTVNRILSISFAPPRLREAAKKAASQARFSITKVNGRPVTVRGSFPMTLQAPR